MILALLGRALADDGGNLADLVEQARASIADADFAAAKTRLYEAEGYMPRAPGPLPGPMIAQVPFLFGTIAWQEGDREVAMGWWRKALVMSPSLAPERGAFPDMEAQDVFHAIAEEVRSGDEVVLTLAADPRGSLWVDGVERMDGDSAPLGRHLIQVGCGEDRVVGSWYEFGAPPADWFAICDGGSYAKPAAKKSSSSAKPASSSTSSKSPKPEEEDLDDPPPKSSKSSSSAKSSSTKSSSSSSSKSSSKATKSSGGFGGKDVAGIAMIAVGAGGGVASWWTWQRASQAQASWQAKLDASGDNPELQPKEYRETVVVPRYTQFYAAAGGTALFLAGGVVLVLVDEGPSFAPVPGGGAVLWHGRF